MLTKEEAVRVGASFATIQERREYAIVFDIMREQATRELTGSQPYQSELREEKYRMLRAIQDLQGTIDAFVGVYLNDAEEQREQPDLFDYEDI